MSASLTIQTIRVQPTTDTFTTAEAEATTTTNTTVEVAEAKSTADDDVAVTTTSSLLSSISSSAATTVKTQELSGVWCPLLMTLANNTFCMNVNNEKKPFAFNGNSRILYKPQIQYSTPNNDNNKKLNSNSYTSNNCYINNSQKQQQQRQQQKQLRYYIPNYCLRCCCSHCRHYRQITSGRLSDTINPQITKTIKDTTNNNLKVYCVMDTLSPIMITNTNTNTNTNEKENFFLNNLQIQNPLPFIIFKSLPNSLVLLIVSHESLYRIPYQQKAIWKFDLENYNNDDDGGSTLCSRKGNNLTTITRENLNKCLIKASENNVEIKNKTSIVQCVNGNDGVGAVVGGVNGSIEKIVKNLDKFTVLLIKRK